MRFGLFGGATSGGKNGAQGYFGYLDFVMEAEALGYHAVFMTEHHFTGWGQVSAPLHLLSWLAARTSRIRLGTAVMVLAWHNPMLLSEQAATIDLLSSGRLDLGVGRGYRHNEFHGFAMDPEEADERFDEAMAVMIRAWTEPGRFSHHGRFWHFQDAVLEPGVTQQPHPPIWVSAGQERSIIKAAEQGYNLLLDQFTPTETIKSRIALYRASVEAQGRRFDPGSVALARDVHIAADAIDTEDALRRRAAGHQRMIDVSQHPAHDDAPQITAHGTRSHILAWADRPEERTEAALYGTPAEIAGKLGMLRDAGVTYVLANILEQSRETLQRLMTNVAPMLAD